MEGQRKKSPALFILLVVAYAVFSTIGNILSWYRYSWGNVLIQVIGDLSMAALALLAVVFSGKKIKPAALTFSILNLLGALYAAINSFRYGRASLAWLFANGNTLFFAVASLLLLLNAADVIRSRKALAIVLFAMGGSVLLLDAAQWLMYYRYSLTTGRFLPYMLSHLCLYCALGVGMLHFTRKSRGVPPNVGQGALY